jgi:hypothetical protein
MPGRSQRGRDQIELNVLFNRGFECGLRTERVENAYASLGSVGSGDAAIVSDRASWKRSRRVHDMPCQLIPL